ncbi:PEP-CTERM/exosortase system-associated acyltransferase [Methylococcaceae bacterium WWC4]|nr:PEP-CTERM/exosortase system-associated acyltransferase [Methylococcaceae bacterium WWC4]OHX37704.1 PEP-CTERM/exosortase system-associated acyltransferase [Methylomonas sp. LWB]
MEPGNKVSVAESFSRFFSVALADQAEQKDLVYRIRYRVYCEEFKYESTDHFPDQMEMDDYDKSSLHCLITHKESGMPAGCVRLVPADGDRMTSPLPFERYCSESLNVEMIDAMKLDRHSVCEISRLAVDGAFRRRSGETLTRFGEINGFQFSPQEQRTFSSIAVACFFAATVLTEMVEKTNVFAMMEPFLPRMMGKSGIHFQRVGKDIDYHGIRAPYFITTQSALENMHPELKELYQWIRANIYK